MTKLGCDRSRLVLRQEEIVKVVFYFSENPDFPHFGPSIYGVCPSNDDSIYLGQALNSILFQADAFISPNSLRIEELKTLLWDVVERSHRRNFKDWEYGAGWKIDRSRLSSRPLDPTEDVDESNWMEKGHFKRCNKESDTDESDVSSDVISDATQSESSNHIVDVLRDSGEDFLSLWDERSREQQRRSSC